MDPMEQEENLAGDLYLQFCLSAQDAGAKSPSAEVPYTQIHPLQWKIWMRFARRTRELLKKRGWKEPS